MPKKEIKYTLNEKHWEENLEKRMQEQGLKISSHEKNADLTMMCNVGLFLTKKL